MGRGVPRFWRILKATERSFLYLYDKILGVQFAIASPTPNSGDLTPAPASPLRDLRPCTFGELFCNAYVVFDNKRRRLVVFALHTVITAVPCPVGYQM